MLYTHRMITPFMLLFCINTASAHDLPSQPFSTIISPEQITQCMELFKKHPGLRQKLIDINITVCAQFLPHPKDTTKKSPPPKHTNHNTK